MNRLCKVAIISISAISITLSSATIFAKASANNKNSKNKYENLTAEAKKIKADKKIKVDKMLSDAEADIIQTFKINKNSYTKVNFNDLPNLSKGTFATFNYSFCKEAIKIINFEFMEAPEGSLEPTILINEKKLLFLYKDKYGTNFIKKYKFTGKSFEKASNSSTVGKKLSLEQYN